MTPLASPLTDQLQGWGTVLGALFSGIAAAGAIILLWHEMNARREERFEREIGQARTIVATVGRFPRNMTDRAMITAIECRIENCGTAPVTNLSVLVTQPVTDDETTHLAYLRSHPVVPPGSVSGDARLSKGLLLEADADPFALPGFEIELRFTDAAGIRWSRTNNGQPTKTHQKP